MKIFYFITILLLIPVEQSLAENVGLVKAAEAGDTAAVLGYLERGESVESRDEKGKTALIAASQHGHTALVKLLLDKGAAVNAGTTRGSTALYYAAQNHHTEALKLLHARGADVNVINLNKFSPLSVAVTNRDEEVVRLLLDFGADPNAQPAGSPLLTEALSRDAPGIFQVLLEKGADVNATREGYGETTLMIAVALQRMEAVKLLLNRGADIRAKDADDKRVLHWLLCNTFSKGENTKLLELLLRNNADFNGQARSLVGFKDGSTPLMCAVRRDFQKSVKMLLARRPDVDRKNKDGHTALYYAVEEHNVAMVKALLDHGANPALEAEVKREARLKTEIGRMLLTALQPSLEVKSGKCPGYSEKPASLLKRRQPLVRLDPLKSQNFPVARVEVLNTIPPVGHKFSLSPDGKWLVVRENHQKIPQTKPQRLVVYDIAKQQAYFFSPKRTFRVAEDRWLKDSSRYVLGDKKQLMIDVSSGRPRLQTLQRSLPQGYKLFAGGDPCPWRNSKGQVVLSRPNRDDRDLAWSSDGKVVYSLQAGGVDEYYLIAQRGKVIKKLIRHSAKWLRDHEPFYTEVDKKAVPASERAEFEKFKGMLQKMPLQKLTASQFVLSPNDRYLYYRIGQAGGAGFFALANRDIVVDLESKPVQVWYIDKMPWGTPQWHPNGRDLYFIDQNMTAQSDPDFPPMRQPARWGLSVVRFP